jgi:hypothetical protein
MALALQFTKRMRDRAEFSQPIVFSRDRDYRPHWAWFVGSLVGPAGLLLTSLLGLGNESMVSLDVAAILPAIAVLISLGVVGAALIYRRRLPLRIATAGFLLTSIGFLWLYWVSHSSVKH